MTRLEARVLPCWTVAVLSLLHSSIGEAGTISGRVLDSRGRPFASVTVEIVAVDEPGRKTTGAALADGSFRVQLPPDWPASTIQFSAAGAVRVRSREVVTGGDELELGLVVLPAGQLVQGVVRNEAGEPLPDAHVTATNADGRGDVLPGSATTDASGQYAMTDAPERIVQMTVRHPQYISVAAPGTRSSWILKRGGVVQGLVVDGRGAPVANARVTAGDHVERSDANGRFTVSGISPGMSHVVATDDRGAIGARDLLVVDRKTIATTLSLQPGVVVTGITRDSTSGRPLPWVRVRVYQGTPFTVSSQDDLSVVSDASGAFRVVGLASGRYVFEAVRFGFLRAVQTFVLEPGSRPNDASMTLMREARIEGRVIEGAGQPVAGAAVVLKESNPVQEFARQLRAGRREAASTYTDQNGRFVLKDLWPGRALRLEASSEGFPPSRLDGIELAAASTRSGITLTLHRGVIAGGLVTDEQDRPLPNVAVYCTRIEQVDGMGANSAINRAPAPAATTDRDGRYVLANLDPGRYFFTFAASGYAKGLIPATSVVAGTLNELPAVTLSSSARIRGRVVDDQQHPVQGANVFAIDHYLEVIATTSDANGAFDLANLSPGDEVSLQVESDGMATKQMKVRVPMLDLRIQLSPSTMLRGRVVEADSRRPITDFSVERIVRVPGSTTFRIGASAARSFHSDEGVFELGRVPPGPCVLKIRAPGYQTAEVAVSRVPTTDEIEVAVTRGATLTGRVVLSGTREPVANVTITWRQGDPARADLEALFSSLATGEDTTVTDGNGRFVLEGLPTGAMTLFANHAEHAPVRTNVSLPTRSAVEMTISSGGTLAGVVVLDQGGPAAGATVSVAAAGERMGMAPADTTTTDGSGRFKLGHLRQGSYTVVARSATGASRPQVVAIGGEEQQADVVLTLEGGTTVRGVVRGLPREALSSVFVMAHGEGYYDSTQTDAAGAFTLSHVPPGVVGLEATTSFQQGVTAGTRVLIAEGGQGAIDVEIEFAGQSSVTGMVTRSGRPAAAVRVDAVPAVPIVTTRGRTESQDDGTFQIDGLQDGRYELIASGPFGAYRRSIDVRGATRSDIDMPAGSLGGTVTDAVSHRVLDGASITAVSGRERTPAEVRRATTDAAGRYALSDLDPGAYQLRVTKSGYQQEVRSIAVQQDEAIADFELHARGGFIIRIVDARTSAALGRASVRVVGQTGLVFAETMSLDDGGRGEIPSLAPGRYLMTVEATDYAPRSLALQVPAGVVDVALEPGGRLQLRSNPSKVTRVRLVDASGLVQSVPRSNVAGWVDIVGPVTAWPNVAAGTYRLESMTGATTTIVITSGATSTVNVP